MIKFGTYIYPEFFTLYDKVTDPNKDVNGKGTDERFNETIGESMDEYLIPLIINALENLQEPLTALERYIPFLESQMGYDKKYWTWFFNQPIITRRNILMIMPSMYKIRSTEKAYEIMFHWLGIAGLTVNIIETPPVEGGWDSPYTFDSDERTFDMGCPTCSGYTIELTGDEPDLTQDQIEGVQTVVNFNQPINAELENITYNANPIIYKAITVWVDAMGDLHYNNDIDPDLLLTLDAIGNLIIDGPNASHYSMDKNGDLIYTL